MNKTVIININGIVFHIEEDAYEILRNYMISIKKHFAHTEGNAEIVADIENRIAEMFNERISSGVKEVITQQDVDEVCKQMGRVEDFYKDAENDPNEYNTTGNAYGSAYATASKKLMRDPDDKVFGGVCAGLGHYLDMEPRWVRLIMLFVFLAGGTGLLLYIILWIVMPEAKTRADRMAMRGEEPNLQNFKRSFDEERESGTNHKSSYATSGSTDNFFELLSSIGIVLLKILGGFLLFVFGITLVSLLVGLFAAFLVERHSLGNFPLAYVEPKWFYIIAIASFFMLAIPFLALTLLTIRVLFDKKPVSSYISYALLILWIVSSAAVIAIGIHTGRDFQEEASVVEEYSIEASPSYVLEINDTGGFALLDGNTSIGTDEDGWTTFDNNSESVEGGLKKVTSRKVRVRKNWLYRPIAHIYIEKGNSNSSPSIMQEFTAKGETVARAAERAGKLSYQAQQEGEKLVLDRNIYIPSGELLRDQRGKVVLRFPIGTVLLLSRAFERQVESLPTYQCRKNHGEEYSGYTEWVMTEDGLKCSKESMPAARKETINEDSVMVETETIEIQPQ